MPTTQTGIEGPHLRGYLPEEQRMMEDITIFNTSNAWAAGAIISSAADVNTFFAALLAGQIVPPALVEQMRQTVPTSAGFDYGLGLVKLDLSCGPAWGHFGHIPGYATFTYHTATRHVTVSASSMPALDDDRNFNDMLRTIMVGLCTT